jgi:multidrug efflux pump subunit AcrB
MHFLTGWFIRNPVAANLLMVVILLMGAATLSTMRIEGFPRIAPESVTITTSYPGAPAQKVDNLVSRKIETAMEGLKGVRGITALSHNGLSEISVRRAGGQDIDTLLDQVRLRVEGVLELPKEAERPRIEASAYDFPALYINLHGDTDPSTLHTLAKRLKEELLAEPELSRLKLWGLHKQEIRIEPFNQKLQQLDLTIADIVGKIRASSLQSQAGSLKTEAGEIYLRADRQAEFSPQFSAIPIAKYKNGDEVLLGQLATVHDTFVDGDFLFTFNGQPTSGMEVLVGHTENLIRISEVVHRVVDDFRRQLPKGVEATVWGDSADYIGDRLELLTDNGIQGLMLVTLILALFLNVKLAFWVAMGIPISVMGAIAIVGTEWVGYSLNDITTFGFIIALGILVDDAVVVGESVFEQRKTISDPITGTEAGVAKVSVATVFGVLTTVAAFFPMLLLDNPLAKVLAGFSGVVIAALIFSLLESKLILPAHLAQIDINKQSSWKIAKAWSRIQSLARLGLNFARDKIYVPLLAFTVHHRYAALVVFISIATLLLGQMMQGKIKTVFFPDVPGQIISVSLEMDPRSPFKLTRSNVETIRQVGEAINQSLQAEHAMDQPPIRVIFEAINSAEFAQIYAELAPVSDRPGVGILEIISLWRDRVGQMEGATQLQFSGAEEIGGGFKIKLASRDRAVLKLASEDLQQYLHGIKGVHSIRDSLSPGQAELQIDINPEAETLGFDTQTLAEQIGYAYGGAEVQKIQRGDTELRVLVQRSAEERNTVDDLLKSHIRNADGQWISVSAIASIQGQLSPKTLYRENTKWVNVVSASIDRSSVSPEEVSQAIFSDIASELEARYTDLKVSIGGELEEIVAIQGGLKKALLLAAVLIYVLMAVPLKSYVQPVVILAIIPFGFVGAILGHVYLDLPLSLFSLFGMLALAGVVVNDSLVMLTRYNEVRKTGVDHSQAIQEAAISRFQAIFLTTATTVIGLMPLLSETSEQAQYLIPAAASLAYGELFATVLMLLLVPVLIVIIEDIKQLFSSKKCQAVVVE